VRAHRQVVEAFPQNMLGCGDDEHSIEYPWPVSAGRNPGNRATARKAVLERKERLDAEQRRREDRETDLATDYLLACVERDRARETLRRSEAKIGHVIDTMLDELGASYPRLTELLELSEPEIKRLRKLARESAPAAPRPRRDHGAGTSTTETAVGPGPNLRPSEDHRS
jgi:hypothetical protein